MVRHQRANVNGALHALVLAADVEDAQLVSTYEIDIEADAVNFGNADDQQGAASFSMSIPWSIAACSPAHSNTIAAG